MTAIFALKFIVFILFAHYIGDFICQSRKMGDNKSSSWLWLSYHVLIYTLVMMVMTLPVILYFKIDLWLWVFWIVANGAIHFSVDSITSRLTGYFYLKAKNVTVSNTMYEKTKTKKHNQHMKMFWSTIGIDQFIHGATLILTFIKIFL